MLTQSEQDAIRHIGDIEAMVMAMVTNTERFAGGIRVDQVALEIARSELQQGFSAFMMAIGGNDVYKS